MILKAMTEADQPIIDRWDQDERLNYYIKTDPPNKDLPCISWGIYIGENQELVGWSNLFNIDKENLRAEFGIGIPDQKHIRLGVFASRWTLAYGFRELFLHRIYVRPLASNVLAYPLDIRDRGGFVREGVEREAVLRGDIWEDVIVMGILRDEFEKRWGDVSCQQFQQSAQR